MEKHAKLGYLRTTLRNLHLKFLSENPEVKLSLASFCRLRPAHIKLTKFISRSCCFCTKHQTFALCTQALRKCGIDVPLNPEKCIEDAANIEKMKENTSRYYIWAMEESSGRSRRQGKTKMAMKVITRTLNKGEFLKHMKVQVKKFTESIQLLSRKKKGKDRQLKGKYHRSSLPKNPMCWL
ncbi:hypothetical protein MAR_034447 [Mya arenaria]|uniref:Uncharacterized protein n=1 Tax=Mya arenaria TaxID=6604 RepID=A0ABY7GCU4_MYAAR|nr:hypothetical protein MAR_034447 [Mya arenaria]